MKASTCFEPTVCQGLSPWFMLTHSNVQLCLWDGDSASLGLHFFM